MWLEGNLQYRRKTKRPAVLGSKEGTTQGRLIRVDGLIYSHFKHLFPPPLPPPPPPPPIVLNFRRMQIIGYTKTVIVQLLESNPPTLPAFMGQAEEMGMLR